MCGIAGIMTCDGAAPDPAALDKMQAALAHRGPDGQGGLSDGGTGLVQTRLAIIDLETGAQPIYASGVNRGRKFTAVIANGEIYNDLELRAGLDEQAFATRSDCEVPLHLYESDGLAFAEHLRGMFAIAIYDGDARRLLLARDPFGIKPLYYVQAEDGFAFASEPQALIAAGLVAPKLAAGARDELLETQFVSGRATALAGIERVLPGETLEISSGRIVGRRRQAALPEGAPIEIGEAEALRRLDDVLMESVELHQRSDVPYGMFLSGGVDSSVVLACMRDLNEHPVQVFTTGFSGTGAADEREHARATAAAAGADFHAVEFGPKDFWNTLPRLAGWLDDPAADYAILPTYKLAQAAREHDLKVILTGEGGDELFAGYGRYRRQSRAKIIGGREMRSRGIFDGLGVLRGTAKSRHWRDGIARAERAADQPGRTRLQIAQAADCADWLAHDLLIKLDRCLMAHGVEGRVPLLDRAVAEFAFRLPDSLKIKRGLGKWLLRQWLETKLPEARPFEAKRGFTVPVGEWIAARGKELGALVAAQPGIEEACDADRVRRLYSAGGKRQGQAQWVLLFFALWHNHHILGRGCEGDVFDVLAAKD